MVIVATLRVFTAVIRCARTLGGWTEGSVRRITMMIPITATIPQIAVFCLVLITVDSFTGWL
jgi:hypothetical protein